MDALENLYIQFYLEKSDIHEHFPILREYASKCDHITEFGVRSARSTIALAFSFPNKMISYDINPMPEEIKNVIKNNINFEFIQANTLEVEIEETDLLFIDTLHTYEQLTQELLLHQSKVRKYILLHDTESFGEFGEDHGLGLKKAYQTIIGNDLGWEIHNHYPNNNGLTILGRKNDN